MSIPADRSPPFEEGRISTRVRSSSTPPGGTAVEGLTDDLLVEILSRVPAKSLCRLKCVSNNWLSLIDHPDHRKKLPQALAGFLHSSTSTYEWRLEAPVHFTGFPGRRCPPVDTSCTFLPSHRRVEILDCCNGLLLCRWECLPVGNIERLELGEGSNATSWEKGSSVIWGDGWPSFVQPTTASWS